MAVALVNRLLRGGSSASASAMRSGKLVATLPLVRRKLIIPASVVAAKSAGMHRRRRPSLRIDDNFASARLARVDLPERHRRWGSGGGAADGKGDAYTAEQRREDHRHCVEMVQTRDMEGYLCGLLMPSASREAYFALRAFNAEIAGIKDAPRLVSSRARPPRFNQVEVTHTEGTGLGGTGVDPSLASRLRMQWWRDAIAEIYDGLDRVGRHQQRRRKQQQQSHGDSILRSLTSSRRHNPTLRSLAQAIRDHGLTHRFLRRMMEAREADLNITQYDSVRDMARYGEDTVSSVLYLSLECAGVRDDAADTVASDIGVALGLVTALRATGFRAAQGESSVPADLAGKHGVSMDTLWEAWDDSIGDDDGTSGSASLSTSREALRGAVREMAGLASFHLVRARDNQHAVPREGRACLLSAVCGLRYLNSLEECNYDVLHSSLVGGGGDEGAMARLERRRRLGLMFLLGRAWLTGIF